jgi:copper homeostasis protein (lipoprotein)
MEAPMSSGLRSLAHGIIALSVVTLVCGAGAPAWAGSLEGIASARERIDLPADAVFEAVLEEVGRPNTRARLVGRATIEPAGQPPIRFRIAYADADVRPGGRYVVRATIRQRGQVLFTTEQAHPVPMGGVVVPFNLVLVSASSDTRLTPRAPMPPKIELPSSFEGEIPDASGRIVGWHLDLLHAGRYQLRTTDKEKPEPTTVDEVGRWWRDDAGRLIFRSGLGPSTALRPDVDGRTLRWVDTAAAPDPSRPQYLLKRMPRFSLIEPRLPVTGLFTPTGETPTIVLCADDWRLPVATQADYRSLEAAYLKQRQQPGQAFMVSVEGMIAVRPVPDPLEPPRRSLVVERFVSISSRESCDSPLRGTYWKLVRLGTTAVPAADKPREAHLVFGDESRVSGSGGCNRLTGGFELDGDKLRLTRMAGTKMACAGGMEQEQNFLQSIDKVDRYRIKGPRLDLLDATDTVLARFEAVESR